MLTDAERRTIEADLGHYPDKRAACIEALKVVQSGRGWISDEALRDVAELLGLSVAELDGVATFFNQIYRKPVGKHVILLCDSVTCYLLGYERLQEELQTSLQCRLGGTSPDGAFTLLPTQCLGCCDRGPALMIDDDLHQELVAERIAPILATYRGET